MTVKSMREKFAIRQQIGFLGFEHLDAKLIRAEAVKVLQMNAETE